MYLFLASNLILLDYPKYILSLNIYILEFYCTFTAHTGLPTKNETSEMIVRNLYCLILIYF